MLFIRAAMAAILVSVVRAEIFVRLKRTSYDEAQAACQDQAAELAHINSLEDIAEALAALAATNTSMAWIAGPECPPEVARPELYYLYLSTTGARLEPSELGHLSIAKPALCYRKDRKNVSIMRTRAKLLEDFQGGVSSDNNSCRVRRGKLPTQDVTRHCAVGSGMYPRQQPPHRHTLRERAGKVCNDGSTSLADGTLEETNSRKKRKGMNRYKKASRRKHGHRSRRSGRRPKSKKHISSDWFGSSIDSGEFVEIVEYYDYNPQEEIEAAARREIAAELRQFKMCGEYPDEKLEAESDEGAIKNGQ